MNAVVTDPGVIQTSVVAPGSELDLADLTFNAHLHATPVVRPMAIEDLERVLSLLKSDHNLAFMDQEEQHLRNALLHPDKYGSVMKLVMVDRDSQDLIGVALGNAGFRAHLSHLIIARPYRGNEFGAELLRNSVEWFRGMGCPRMILTLTADNNSRDKALGFYQRHGFSVQPGEVSMEKDL